MPTSRAPVGVSAAARIARRGSSLEEIPKEQEHGNGRDDNEQDLGRKKGAEELPWLRGYEGGNECASLPQIGNAMPWRLIESAIVITMTVPTPSCRTGRCGALD